MASSSKKQAVSTKSALLKEIQELAAKSNSSVTRNFYRENSKYSEADWQKFFPKFNDFLAAAGLDIPSETSEISGDKWTIALPRTNIHTLEQLVEYCEIDLSVWEVERFVANKWDANAGAGETMPLFQIKAFLKKKAEVVAVRKEIEELKELAKSTARSPKYIARPAQISGNMLEINVPDAHFGKLSWGVETGHENYDTKIAQATFMRALETLLDRTKAHKFDEVLFVVGNDLFNSDDIEGRTTKGTSVSTDGRYHKTFYKVRTTIIASIERLRQVAPVKVVMVSGNHDELSVWHLGDSLECYFHQYKDVEIDNAPRPRKYHQFGNVMLMFTHGDKGKRADYPLLMATENSVMFGATKYREAHTGHTHMTKLDEQHGVRVRVLPALCPPDDWHSEQGFVCNLRNAEAYVWNRNEGLVGIALYSDDAQEPITTKRVIG